MKEVNLLCEIKDDIGYITINRPNLFNAINRQTVDEFAGVLSEWRSKSSCKIVVITGAGEKAFCAGADINTFIESFRDPVGGGREWSQYGQKFLDLLETYEKPVIAAVNGLAMGGGLELALACSFIIASENAIFGAPEVTFGIMPAWGATQRLGRLVGKGRALQMILTGDPLDAQEAYRIGIVNMVVPQHDLMSSCRRVGARIILNAPIAVRLSMEAVVRGLNTIGKEGFLLESYLAGLACQTEDAREGFKAFVEKRKPVFHNR
jgi:enoyl-CoA hydratase